MVKVFRYLFVRRLAVNPYSIKYGDFDPGIYLFEWQEMPRGYRWF